MKKTTLLSLVCASLVAQNTFTLNEQVVTASHITQNELSYTAPIEIYTDEMRTKMYKQIIVVAVIAILSIEAVSGQIFQKYKVMRNTIFL